jgi:signal peptide peptidase SppA
MNGRLVRLMSEFYRQPWAILPETLAMLSHVLHRAAAGVQLAPDEIRRTVAMEDGDAAAASPRRGPPQASGPNTIAVLSVSGIIGHRAHLVEDSSSGVGTSTEILGRHFRALVNDSNIGAIVFDHESPGGSAFGIPELAAEIFAARGKKPMVAVVNSLSASASYWLASQADEVVVTPGGQAGSIGVWTAHEDWSAFLEKKGVKVSYIHAGKYKVEGNYETPLTDEARAAIQHVVDQYYGMFVADVARGRGDTPAKVKSGYGEGRVLIAQDAVSARLADRIATMDQVIAELQQRLGGGSAGARAHSREDAQRAIRLAELGA